MPTATPTLLAQNLTATLSRLRAERADADPSHDAIKCSGVCAVCAAERALNRLLERVPRQESHV
jgi:hypothetical protein